MRENVTGAGVEIGRTNAVCLDCRTTHPARIERVANEVYFVSECPAGSRRTRISTNADIFLGLRKRSAALSIPEEEVPREYKWTYLINVTNDCNFQCPVCLNPRAEGEARWYLSSSELEDVVSQVRHGGRRAVMLTGGEPSQHPDLPALITSLTERDFRVGIATNGARIAAEDGYAKALRRAGASMVFLQMDTLDEDVHMLMRGNRRVNDKLRATQLSIDAGLRIGFVVTATRHSVATLNGLLEYCLSLGPALSVLNIQIAAPFGRFALSHEALVDREYVLEAISGCSVLKGQVRADDFFPQPVFAPWQSAVHPDCSANLMLLSHKGEAPRSLGAFVDMAALYGRLSANQMAPTFWARNLVPLYHALCTVRKGSRITLMRHLLGLLRRRGRRGFLAITVNDLMGRDALDEQRLRRCTTCVLSASGGTPACLSCWNNSRPVSSSGGES